MGKKIQCEGTVFACQGDGPTRSELVRLEIPQIDWLETAKQKSALVKLLWNDPDNPLWGVVHLLDEIQDQAEEAGHNVVWPADACLEPAGLQATMEGGHEI